MAISQRTIIRISSPDGTQRRRLPRVSVTSARWTRQRYGGYADCTLATSAAPGELSSIQIGDRVDIYRDVADEDHRRYRGYLSARNTQKGESGPDTLTLEAFGVFSLIKKLPCSAAGAGAAEVGAGRAYAFPASVDVGDAFAAFAQDCLVNAEGPNGRPLVSSVQTDKLGITCTALDARYKVAGDVLDDFQRLMGNLGGYGGDVAADGSDRVYMRASAPLSPPTHVIAVPHRRVKAASADFDTADVMTALLIEGGPSSYPQKLHNGQFDQPVIHEDGLGDLLKNGDFERTADWTLLGGADYKGADDGGVFKGQPFSGKQQIELDNVGEAITQTQILDLAGGHDYTLAIRARQQFAANHAAGSASCQFLSASGAVLATASLTLTPAATDWAYFSSTVRLPADAASYAVRFQCDAITRLPGNAGGLMLDAAELFDASVAEQDGWQLQVYDAHGGNPGFLGVNWLYRDEAHSGGSCVFLNVHSNDADEEDCHLEPLGEAHASCTGQQTLRFGLWYKSPASATAGIPKFRLDLTFYAGDGHSTNTGSTIINGGIVVGDWTYAEVVATAHGDSTSCTAVVDFRGSGPILLDDLSLIDAAAPTASYQPEGNLRFVVFCDDADLAAAYPSGAALYAGRRARYGLRCDPKSESSILSRSDALAYADNYFRGSGEYRRPALTLSDWPARIAPGDSLLLAGSDGPSLADSALIVARAEETDQNDILESTLEVERESPDEISVVNLLIAQNLRKFGSGGSQGGTSGGSGSSVGGGSGTVTPTFRETLQASAADVTLHDDYTGAPHASASSQAVWTGTSNEVVAARTSTLNGEFGSLDARIEYVEAHSGGAGSAPATASAFGTVETDITESGGSVVYTKATADSKFALATNLTAEATARSNADMAEATARVSGDALALQKSQNLGDLANAGTARTNLGLGSAATKDVPATGNASAGQVVLGSDTRLSAASGISITESIGNGADLALTTAYQTISTISINVAANAAADADALVEVVADSTTGGDDLYLQLYDTVAAAAIQYSERHVSNVAAGKRGQILLSKYVPGAAAGRTLVLQAKNATAARGSVNTNRSLLQALGVSSGGTSGGGITSPTQVAGLTVWLNAGAITGVSNGAPLATWNDASGGSHNATQATGTLQPVYIASALGSKPAVRFNGTSQFMTLGNLSSYFPSAASLFVVVTYNGVQYQCVYSTAPYTYGTSGSQAGDDFWYYTAGGSSYLSMFSSTRSGAYGAPMPSSGSNLFSYVAGASTAELWVNQVDKGTISLTFTGGTSHLLGHSNNSANNCYLNGDISEIIIYNTALSTSDRQSVEAYLKNKYAI